MITGIAPDRRIDSGAASAAGLRPTNEDSVCLEPDLGLFAVADGVGGYPGGDIASALAVRTLASQVRLGLGSTPAHRLLETAFDRVQAELRQRQAGALSRMSTTLAAL